MKKNLISFLCILGVSLGLSGCVTTTGSETTYAAETAPPPAKTYQAGMQSVTVGVGAGGGFHEFCEDEWKVGDRVNFSFSSTKPLVFNVHYHDANHVKHYTIEDMLVDDFSGDFTVENQNIHCGMWQNNTDSFVKLTYDVKVVEE